MSEGRRLNKTGIRCALATLAVFSGLLEFRSARALEWEPVEGGQQTISSNLNRSNQTTQPSTPLTGHLLSLQTHQPKNNRNLNWTAVSEEYKWTPNPSTVPSFGNRLSRAK